ncbi:hypothetical protein [Frondihabitans sp. VKM Ac-2883]|uniref:hypothetical protein n=1 Tax=Frondihabitans sp. VKM Ac-2883 TaxID=2783823 RepID=UPI00188D5F02|nr:hypothetical protein [Frondihabitans sp. VKM Ac-2883]MBF4575049.1 hypothetical protein [Frondihabitans sp. VKM Ac-2883]
MTETITSRANALLPGYGLEANALRSLGLTERPLIAYAEAFDKPLTSMGFVPTEIAVTERITAQVQAMMAAGEPIPEDFAEPILVARRHDEARELLREIEVRILSGIIERTDIVTPQDVEAPLAYLSEELRKLVAEAQELALQLDGAQTASEVIRVGGAPLKAWKRLGELEVAYEEIRLAQFQYTKAAWNENVTPFNQVEYERIALFSDAMEVVPYFTTTFENMHNPAGRPTSDDLRSYFDWIRGRVELAHPLDYQAEPEYFLVQIATKSTPWLPSIRELEDATNASRILVQNPSIENLHALEEARADYYAAIGVEHEYVKHGDTRHIDLASATSSFHQ